MDRGRFTGSAFWLAGLVVLLTGAGLFVAFGPRPEPPRVKVRHILISFGGAAVPSIKTKAEAEKLAFEILDRARNGEDFEALEKRYSDDPNPSPYTISNIGIKPQTTGEMGRLELVKSFGDVSFKLRVGEIRMAAYDPPSSPFGWHIIKRIE